MIIRILAEHAFKKTKYTSSVFSTLKIAHWPNALKIPIPINFLLLEYSFFFVLLESDFWCYGWLLSRSLHYFFVVFVFIYFMFTYFHYLPAFNSFCSLLFLCSHDFPFGKITWRNTKELHDATLLNLLPAFWLLSSSAIVKRKEGNAWETVKRGVNDGKDCWELAGPNANLRPSCSSRWFVFPCPSARVLNELTASVQLTRLS